MTGRGKGYLPMPGRVRIMQYPGFFIQSINNQYMKTSNFLNYYKILRKRVRRYCTSTFLAKMVADNITDLLLPGWTINADWSGDIQISPKEDNATADQFDRMLKKLSRVFNYEPSKNIDSSSLFASIYFDMPVTIDHDSDKIRITIYVISKNTESCEIVEREVTETKKVFELTGYCKALNDKKYLQDAAS